MPSLSFKEASFLKIALNPKRLAALIKPLIEVPLSLVEPATLAISFSETETP